MAKKEKDEVNINIQDGADSRDTGQKEEKPEKQDKAGEYLEQLQRLQAEFSNYRRRVEREWKEVSQIAKAGLSLKFVSVVDDLERLLEHHENDRMIETEGVRMILQKCRKLLDEEGVQPINAVGEVFDPEKHAAVTVESVDEDRDDIVLEEWQKGYIFGERLLRPSQVKVGRYQPEAGD